MKKYRLVLLSLLILLSVSGVTLQLGLLNWGQHFGTYGQYNRVLDVARGMHGYKVVQTRLSRRLDWRNVGHLDRFSLTIRDAQGRTGSIEFVHGSSEMQERDPGALERLIKSKLESLR